MVGALTAQTNNVTTLPVSKPMNEYPQHIKKRCSIETFQSIESGIKNFEVKLNDMTLDEGDFVTFVEMADDEETGRSVTRRITHMQPLHPNSDFPEKDLNEHGLVVLGFEDAEKTALRTLLDNYFFMALVVDKQDEEWEITDGPDYWPILLAPPLINSGILDELKIDKWPTGVYSIHLKIKPNIKGADEPIALDLIDSLILVLVEGEEEAEGAVVGFAVDPASLLIGQCIGVYGHNIEPAHPDVIANYYYHEDENRSELVSTPSDIDNMTQEELAAHVADGFPNVENMADEDLEVIINDIAEAQGTAGSDEDGEH
jgi:hypothetical protein